MEASIEAADTVVSSMISKVLVATDFSETSEKALSYAVILARRYGAKFYLANVIPPAALQKSLYDGYVDRFRLALEELIRCEGKFEECGVVEGLQHEVLIAAGDLWRELSRIAATEDVDLIVIGTRGRSGVSKLVVGSGAETVFRHASIPVLTIGPCSPSKPRTRKLGRILFPTDLTADSALAIPYAISVAMEHEAELTLLHVVQDVKNQSHDDFETVVALQARLRALLASAGGEKVSARFEVAVGPVEETILNYAWEETSDLVIMGLKNRTPLADHLPWRHAYRIVSEAPCPVLTIRSR